MIDPLTLHQVYIQRLAGGIYRDLIPDLKKLRDSLSVKIINSTDFQRQRLTTMLKEINAIIDDGLKPMQPNLFYDFAEYEQEWTIGLLDKYSNSAVTITSGLNLIALKAAVDTSKIKMADKKSMTINGLIKVFSDRYKKDIKTEIQLGIAEGETTQQLAKRIQLLSNNRTRQQAEAVVRTITNHVGNMARNKVYEANDDIIEYEIYTAVLDSRTSATCMSLSGKHFKVGEGAYPPQHYGCRSVRIPKIKDEYSADIERTQSSEGGYVPADWSYNDWLKRQPAKVQNEILGTARAKAYRKSGDPIARFVDRSGKFYTLNELRQKDLIE